MRFSLEEDHLNRRVPVGLVLLLFPFIYWLAFLLSEGLGNSTARDIFMLFISLRIWGFILGVVIFPGLALVLSFRDYLKSKGSKGLDGWVILISLLLLAMAALAMIFRPESFI